MTERAKGGSPRAALWMAAAAGALLAVSLLLWQFAAAPARLLAAEGVEATATVVEGPEEGGGVVTVAFPAPDGQEVRVRGVVSEAFAATLAEGAAIPVRYARSNPQVLEVEPGALAGPARVTGWLAVAMAALFALALARALRRRGGMGG